MTEEKPLASDPRTLIRATREEVEKAPDDLTSRNLLDAGKAYSPALYGQLISLQTIERQEIRISQLELEKTELQSVISTNSESLSKSNSELVRLKENTTWRRTIEFIIGVTVASSTAGLRIFPEGAGYAISIAFLLAGGVAGAVLAFRK